ncbi:hypothetical protein ACSF6V_10100 [Escherichia coli]|uniref:hypothetical protein n=1 Tax=Escherichia coli TaxID=562 RepID=UPI003EEF5681
MRRVVVPACCTRILDLKLGSGSLISHICNPHWQYWKGRRVVIEGRAWINRHHQTGKSNKWLCRLTEMMMLTTGARPLAQPVVSLATLNSATLSGSASGNSTLLVLILKRKRQRGAQHGHRLIWDRQIIFQADGKDEPATCAE